MRKLLALYTNEMIKISKKIVVIIILVIMVLGVIGFGALMKFQEISVRNQSGLGINQDFTKEEMKDQLKFFKNELKNVEARIKAATTPEEKMQLEGEKFNYQSQVDLYQMAVDKGVNINGGGYKAILINDIVTLRAQLTTLKIVPKEQRTPEQNTLIGTQEANVLHLTTILENKDFKAFIELKNKEIDKTEGISVEEKKLKTDYNNLWLRLDPTGETSSQDYNGKLQNTLSQIENLNRSLVYGIDYSAQSQYVKPLTPEARDKIINDLAILTYKAENKLIDTNLNSSIQIQESAISGMFGFGIFMLVCMMLILAGGAVSQEISTGSIKSLIISPTKRYKIYFAKLASLLSVGVFSALVLYCVSVVVYGVLFGFSSGTSFVFAINGVAMQLNFYLYRFAFLFVNFIDVIVYMMLAFMLSIITRNTAASVGVSIAVYFGGSLANSFISLLARGEWVKFIPFNNLSLASRIFPDPLSSMSGLGMGIFGFRAVVPSTTFSLIYLVVMVFCFGYIAMDSFNRRDI